MKKDLLIHILSAVIILILIVVSYTLLGRVKSLDVGVTESRYVIEEQSVDTAILKGELLESELLNEQLLEELTESNRKLEIEDAMDYNYTIMRQLLDTMRYNYRNILIEQSDLLSSTDMSDYFIMYGSDDNAESVIRYYYVANDESMSLEEKLRLITTYVSAYSFGELPIEFKGIEVVNGKNIAVINLSDPEDKPGAWSIGYFMGSSMGIITRDILVESFLQRETDLIEWIDGVHFEFENERDWITDHDPSICRYTYFRNGLRIEDN